MNLYDIITPVWTNDREKNYEPQRKDLEAFIVDQCGGITRVGIQASSWRNDKGKIVDDAKYVLRFATSGLDIATVGRIVDKALELFADQEAIHVAHVGSAVLHSRPKGE